MGTHFFTSITANYLPKARVLCESLRKFHPESIIHVVWNDKISDWLDVASEPFDHLITVEDFGIPNLSPWLFQHDLVELSTAVKGFALQRLLALPDCDQVVYFDPDILILAPLDGLLREFESASVLLTPHQTEPDTTEQTVRDNELLTLQHGVFNLGFLGVKNSPAGHRFAAWWADRLRDHCFDDLPIGLFTDQRWPDLVPAFFPDHKILREPVYNTAYWNISKRHVEGNLEQGFTVAGQPLVFYHFSGIDSGREWTYLQRWASDMPALFELRDWYLEQCRRQEDAVLGSVPWGYGFFANGDPILKSQRLQYRHNLDLQSRFPDPFQVFPAQVEPVSPAGGIEETVRPYRIFLIAAPSDEPYIDETLAALKAGTFLHDQLWLLTRSLQREMQSIAIDAYRYEDFAAHVLQNFADKDIILIRAGALPPPQWDLRLAWTAARHSNALTVSPLDRRVLDEAALVTSVQPDAFDRLCYFYRDQDEFEVATLSADCVYISCAGASDLAANRKQLRLSNLVDDAARKRWQHLQTTHLCLSFRCPIHTTALARTTLTQQHFLDSLRASFRNHSIQAFHLPRTITGVLAGATLHITHNWGGGIEQWVRNFCEADQTHDHLVLKSAGPPGRFGEHLQLLRYSDGDGEVLQTWTLTPGIRATTITHVGYRQILAEITKRFSVTRIIVSSLIGHSLDCLRSALPTVFVCHDYYPYCSAINLSFGETCRSCEAPRLEACLDENPLNSHFPNVVRSEWLVLRAEFLRAVVKNKMMLVAPSASVQANYVRLAPELAPSFRVIPHGLRSLDCQDLGESHSAERPLRVLILGNLIPHKGVFLLDALLSDLLTFTELTIAGSLDSGGRFADHPKIRVIPEYRQDDLADLIAEVRPDIGLFLSIWPETFSYTLHELQSLCIPPVATNVGSFADAIEEGITGFLCEPEPLSLLHRLRFLSVHPSELAKVRSNLGRRQRRSLLAMVQDYAALLPDTYSAERYFSGPHVPDTLPELALQLYWSGPDEAFSEANSFRFAPYHVDSQTARLYVPASRHRFARLRFDPGSKAGLLQIERMALCRKTGEVLWFADDCRSLAASAVHNNVFPLSATVLCLTGDDPQIELPLSGAVLSELSATGGYLELQFAWHTIEAHIIELLSSPAAIFEKLHEELRLSREQLEKAQSSLAEIKQQVSSQALELEVAHRDTEGLAVLHQSVLDSLSWHVTGPLRRAAELGRRLTGSR